MKKIFKKYLMHLIVFVILIVPTFLFADLSNSTIQNPLKSNDVQGLLTSIMELVEIVAGVVVVFFIIFSGFKFVTAGDSDSDRSKAKDMFYATIIGAAILLGADVIARVVVETVKATTGAR